MQINVRAAVIGLDAVDAGFINAEGRTSKYDGSAGPIFATFNYSAGYIDEVFPLSGSDISRKNYFTFDLSGVAEDIVSATLFLYNPAFGYSSPDPSETYVLGGTLMGSPVTAPTVDMAAFSGDLAVPYDIFDAGPGGELEAAMTLYGEVADSLLSGPGGIVGAVTVSAADDDSVVEVPFAPFGVDYLNAFKGGKVVLGGEIATPDGTTGADEVIFGFTAPIIPGVVTPDPVFDDPTPTPFLVIETIPEPGFLPLVLFAGAFLCLRRRRT